jgi:predicted secreted protein
MRLIWIGLAAAALTASAALANDATCATNVQTYATTDLGGPDIPVVSRGDQFAVACDSIRDAGADVSVVMTLTDPVGGDANGFSSVLATDQKIVQHSVNVQVPDLPDLANHTVSVKVYVTDAKGTRACDAGRVRIV